MVTVLTLSALGSTVEVKVGTACLWNWEKKDLSLQIG